MCIKFVVNYSQKQNQELTLYNFFLKRFNQLLLYQLPPWLSLTSKGQIASLLHAMFCMHMFENLMRDETEMVGDQLPITASSTSTYNNPTLRHTLWLIWVYPSVKYWDIIPCYNYILKGLICRWCHISSQIWAEVAPWQHLFPVFSNLYFKMN